MSHGVIRILILHQNRLFREGLAFILAHQPNITVVGTAVGTAQVLQELEKLRPDAVIMNLCPPERSGLREARRIRDALPEIKILMMGHLESEADVMDCIEAGAAAYLPQEASLEDLLNNIQAMAAGEALCSPKVTGFLICRIEEIARDRERLRTLSLARLTRRELEIIALIEEGLSNKQIAVRLQVEIQTVKNHVHNILQKLQLTGRREVAQYARERGMLGSLR